MAYTDLDEDTKFKRFAFYFLCEEQAYKNMSEIFEESIDLRKLCRLLVDSRTVTDHKERDTIIKNIGLEVEKKLMAACSIELDSIMDEYEEDKRGCWNPGTKKCD